MGKGLRERVTKAKGQDSDRNTAADIAEAAEVGDDDDDDGKSEDGEAESDTTLIAMCKVGGHADNNKSP